MADANLRVRLEGQDVSASTAVRNLSGNVKAFDAQVQSQAKNLGAMNTQAVASTAQLNALNTRMQGGIAVAGLATRSVSGLTGALGESNQAAKSAEQGLMGAVGATTSLKMAFGAALGPIGLLVTALGFGLVGAITTYLGSAKKAREETTKVLDEFQKLARSLTETREMALVAKINDLEEGSRAAQKRLAEINAEAVRLNQTLQEGMRPGNEEAFLRARARVAELRIEEGKLQAALREASTAIPIAREELFKLEQQTEAAGAASKETTKTWAELRAEAQKLAGAEVDAQDELDAFIYQLDLARQGAGETSGEVKSLREEVTSLSEALSRLNMAQAAALGIGPFGTMNPMDLARERGISVTEAGAILNRAIKQAAGTGEIPEFQFGGQVPGPRGKPTLAVVHGGETVVPAGGGAREMVIHNVIMLDGRVVGESWARRAIHEEQARSQ